jgi:hypothetical protein
MGLIGTTTVRIGMRLAARRITACAVTALPRMQVGEGVGPTRDASQDQHKNKKPVKQRQAGRPVGIMFLPDDEDGIRGKLRQGQDDKAKAEMVRKMS